MVSTTAAEIGVRRRDPERTREEILDVAVQEFSRLGYAGARVDEIAAPRPLMRSGSGEQ
jgi:AcrR family transcriptional regulator